MEKPDPAQALRVLPSVTEVDRYLTEQGLPAGKPVRERVRAVLDDYRTRVLHGGAEPTRDEVLQAVARQVRRPDPRQLRRVINATGVVVHTNLGRAVLHPDLTAAALPLLHGYTNLEFDLGTGRRGPRGGRVPELLAELAGAEAALVVNNNASAVLLLLTALAREREVIVSRGELVEIGGAFRVPDIMRQSGATLVEVGTTNRTRLADYADAITERTAALLKVHRSNFAMSGFVEEVPMSEMAALAHERGLQAWHDLGSGNFYRFEQPALRGVKTVAQEVREGADLVTLSGDKLLGSVQAGVVVGGAEPVQRMRRHPLYRSLRMDKLRSVMLEQALLDYLDPAGLRARNPTVDLLERTVADMEPMAQQVLQAVGERTMPLHVERVQEQSLAGGGAVPEVRIETLCLALRHEGMDAESLAARLRAADPPIVARIAEERVLLDLRTLLPHDVPDVIAALQALAGGR